MTGLRKFTSKDLGAIVDATQRYSVGMDDLFYRLHSYGTGSVNESYPPYNIVKESEIQWRIELALAGWSKEDIEVTTESDVEIGTVTFNNGLLVIELRRIIPDHQKHKVYEIQNSSLPEGDAVASSDTL